MLLGMLVPSQYNNYPLKQVTTVCALIVVLVRTIIKIKKRLLQNRNLYNSIIHNISKGRCRTHFFRHQRIKLEYGPEDG